MIHPIAFNDTKTPISFDAMTAGERFAKAFRKLNDFSPTQEHCRIKTAVLKFESLTVIAASSTGHVIETENHHSKFLVLPFFGKYITMIDGLDFHYKAGHTGLFASCDNQRTTVIGSGVSLQLQTGKVNETYSAILGSSGLAAVPLKNRVISLEHAGVSFIEIFKNVFAQIDAVGCDANILGKLALDDALHRLCVGILYPEILITDETRNGKRPYVRPELKRLCEYIDAHLTEAFSLTKMESMSGLSARILQRSFQNAFGLTPKQWVRKQRLHAARSFMLNRREPISITALAYDFCFASPSDFAGHYMLEFGELPSQTHRKKITRVSGRALLTFESNEKGEVK